MLNAAISNVELVSVSAAARALDVSEGTVRLWTRRGLLPCARMSNGTRVIRRSDLEELRTARTARAEQPQDPGRRGPLAAVATHQG